ncbi:MAG: sulfite exporter TauE/SafE family protein [Candidatus Uhrbacteria bacterium]|nr:sulfite exporter TauE/SafE family protein [Patescibacteria group bacterium]MBU1907028.1 sulfite exporter TauE/SafE family protein [Patescibacteria group bacterium]
MSKKKTKLYLGGMSCVSCELRVANELGEIEGMERVEVCHKQETAELLHDEQADIDQVIKAIEKLGYSASLSPLKKVRKIPSIDQWIYALAIVVVLYLLYKLLNNLGLFDWLQVDDGGVTLGIAFLIGIVASLSTCLAVVGGVVISFAAKYQARGSFYESNIKPHLLFHLGRLLSFFFLGGLLGVLGSWFNPSGTLMGWFTIALALVLVWIGLNIMGILPSLTKTGIRMPKATLKTWNRLQSSDHPLTPIVIGAFTFFLPCGFTQSMQLFAVSTGNFLTGALTMLTFGLGTGPVLLGLGFATSRFSNLKASLFKLVIGMVVIGFAYSTLLAGMAQAGIDFSLPNRGPVNDVAVVEGNVQTVKMTADYSGYNPDTFKIKAGVPVRWEIDAKQISGCTGEIIVPDYGIRKQLTAGLNVIEFIPKGPGTIGFSCWMGMVRGKFIVE